MRVGCVAFGILLCAAALAFASGGTEKAAGGEPSGTVVWWSPNFDSPRDAQLKQMFETKNPAIKIEIQPTVPTGLDTKLLVALQAGSGFDVATTSAPWNYSFAKSGTLLPLDEFIKKVNLDVSDFYVGNWSTTQFNGKTYGIPYRASSDGLIYNKKLFREAGLDPEKPPVTWDDVLAYAQKMTRQVNGKKQFGWGLVGGGETNNFIAWFVTTIWSYGGDLFTPDFKKVTINEPAAVQGVTFSSDLYTKHHVAQDSALQDDSNTIVPLFAQDVIGMYLSGAYAIGPTRKANPNIEMGFGVWPRKAGRDPSTNMGGSNFIVGKGGQESGRNLEVPGVPCRA